MTSQTIAHANFHLLDKFLIIVTWTYSLEDAHLATFVASGSCRHFNTCDPVVPFSL